MESTSREPGDPEFVVDRWLHPSMYTAVPDPAWPTGYEQRVQQQVQARVLMLQCRRVTYESLERPGSFLA